MTKHYSKKTAGNSHSITKFGSGSSKKEQSEGNKLNSNFI